MKISRASWHYRWCVAIGTVATYEDSTDACSYSRSLFGALFISSLAVAFVLFFSILAGDLIAWLTWMIVHGQLIGPDGLATVALIALSFFAAFGAHHYWTERERIERPAGPIKVIYTQLKSRFCVLIDFV